MNYYHYFGYLKAKNLTNSMQKFQVALIFILLVSAQCFSQVERTKGKIIENFGLTFSIDNPDIQTNTSGHLKVIFDVSSSSSDKSVRNKYIETAARFLNMHADAGMTIDQLDVAMTIHGGAWHDILNDDAYKKLFGVPNPNSEMIKALNDAGVDIILCGQTKSFRGVEDKDMLTEVKLALSAMTALLQYQNNGYRFIKF